MEIISTPPVQTLEGGRAGWVLVTSFLFLSPRPSRNLYGITTVYIEALRRFFDNLQLSAIDVSARTTMKGAANCDKHCELQNSENQ